MKKYFKNEDLFYITQYASTVCDDQEIYNHFNDIAASYKEVNEQKAYINSVKNIVDNMGSIYDDYNQKIYSSLLVETKWKPEGIQKIEAMTNALKDLCEPKTNEAFIKAGQKLDELTNYSFSNFLADNKIILYEDLEALVDMDLREHGLEANVYLAHGLMISYAKYGDYVQVNDYENGIDVVFNKDIAKEYAEKFDEVLTYDNDLCADLQNDMYLEESQSLRL